MTQSSEIRLLTSCVFGSSASSYPAHFSDVMDLFRGVVRLRELSARTLLLTEAVIDCNSANYSAWHYRRLCLASLHSDLRAELAWSAEVARDTPKNYQIWHHRRSLLETLNEVSTDLCTSELALTAEVLEEDGKNYHAWTHRQWCLKFFTRSLPVVVAAAGEESAAAAAASNVSSPRPNAGIFEQEIAYVDSLLQADVRNNSAWNQRFFMRSLPPLDASPPSSPAAAAAAAVDSATAAPAPAAFTVGMSASVISAELSYAFGKLLLAAHNESVWNYIEGLMKQAAFAHHAELLDLLASVPDFPDEALPVEDEDDEDDEYSRAQSFANRFAQSLLVELWESMSQPTRAARAARWLADELDPVRRKYWLFRATQCADAAKNQKEKGN